MNKFFYLFFLLLFNVIAFSANATNTVDEVKQQRVALEKLPTDLAQLNFKAVGSAKFSLLFWDIYNSVLYTKSGHYQADNIPNSLLFEIEYLKDISAEDLLQRTIEQWQYLGFTTTDYQQYIPLLNDIWPNISSGDKLTLLVQNKQSIFYFNRVKVGQIEAAEFSQLFLDIWLSPKTSQAKLRAQLLGENRLGDEN